MSNVNQSRRRLFNRRTSDAIRPPWSRDDIEFTDVCSRCDKCVQICETNIIVKGDGGFPEINFKDDACTFCKKCAEVCPEAIFNNTELQAWKITATVNHSCLANQGIWCQSCKDACDPRAISFKPAIGQAPHPDIDLDACTGCGACVSPCPNNAISITSSTTSL